VRELRRDRKWTQAALADRAGLSQDMIGLIERGRASPSLGALERRSDAFDVRPPVLFGNSESAAGANGTNEAQRPAERRILEMVSRLNDEQREVVAGVIEVLLAR
jgi:transcriptional regulator with XRE-family HTH domain